MPRRRKACLCTRILSSVSEIAFWTEHCLASRMLTMNKGTGVVAQAGAWIVRTPRHRIAR